MRSLASVLSTRAGACCELSSEPSRNAPLGERAVELGVLREAKAIKLTLTPRVQEAAFPELEDDESVTFMDANLLV